MKKLKAHVRLTSVLALTLLACSAAYAQITPLGDSYTNTAASTINYGAKTLLDVDGATQITYIQFNLASIPTTASISRATLKLYVNTVPTAGSFNVDYVNGAWVESTIDASNAPPLGATIASNLAITTADKNQYILINVTPAVQAWLSGSEANNGIALVANSTFNATFDSKESKTTSHPPELDIAFAGGDGTITGVTTAGGSGLTGGGTSGTLNLSLTNACATNQVLQWNGSAWICASVGTGTITSVTAGTDLTGGGTSGNVTLNLNTANVPQLAASNTFTGNQTVNGNVIATGAVSAGTSFNLGSSPFVYGFNLNAFFGGAGNFTMTGGNNIGTGNGALASGTTGADNTAYGVSALALNSTGTGNAADGDFALSENTSGSGNAASGYGALTSSTTGISNTAVGFLALADNTTGDYNVAVGSDSLGSSTSGGYNVAVGNNALETNTSGLANTGVGNAAGQTIDGSSLTGKNNTALGTGSGFSTGTLNNATALGANAVVGENNALVLGSIKGVNGQTATVNVGIGTTTPDNNLTVNGSADKPGGGSWGTFSDGRLKSLNGNFTVGLSEVLKIRPVRYRYKPDNAMGIRDGEEHIGVVAQEVQKIIPEAVTENSKGYLLVNNDPVIWAMLNAIKEQQQEIRALKSDLRVTRQSLQQIKVQLTARQPTVVAEK
jgi:hypothetical protein